MEISPEVLAINDEVIALRRHFHKHPELGHEEFQTAEKVADFLRKLDLEVKTGVNKTGVVGLLRGAESGPTLMLRADMDALPVQEECDVSYRSTIDGKMHACGHDGHVAMLLGAAKVLSDQRDKLRGNIKFVFEPNEEDHGSLVMIEEGVLENPAVDACFGIHLWSPIETGKIAISSGPVMGGMYYIDITIIGRGGHTATPQTAVDPILTATEMVQALQAIQTREIDVLTPTSIVFGKIKGGTTWNIIPEKVELSGTLRFLYQEAEGDQEKLTDRFERVVACICQSHRAEYELSMIYGHPALVNDPGMIALARNSALEIFGDAGHIVSYMSMAGDDFAEFADRLPSAYIFVGAGNNSKGISFPHHHPRFNIDEDSLQIGVEMFVRTALKYLSG